MGQPVGVTHPEPLIDLGQPGDELRSDRGDGGDGGDGPVRTPRGLALTLVVLLVAAGLVADTPPPRFTVLFSMVAVHNDFEVLGDRLYLLAGPDTPSQISAYGLRDGRQLWRTGALTGTSYDTVYQAGGRMLLVPNPCLSTSEHVSTVAVEAASGREVWRRPGVPEWPIAGGRLVVLREAGTGSGCSAAYLPIDAPPDRWTAVDMATGQPVWTLDIPVLTSVAFDANDDADLADGGSAGGGRGGGTVAGPRRAVFVGTDGSVTSRDLATGAVTGRITLPELASPAVAGVGTSHTVNGPDLTVAGTVAVVTRRLGATAELTGYDVVRLTRRWSVRVPVGPADPRSAGDFVATGGCGPMLCVYGPETVFLDPHDGRERWRTTRSIITVQGGNGLFADPTPSGEEPSRDRLSVYDLRTGRSVVDLSGWRAVSSPRFDRRVPVLAATVDNHTWLATLDLARARLTTVGSVAGLYYACIDANPYLVCRRIDASITVWRTRAR
ncbi:MAG: outer membrane protein assembly factor BamB [Micromonosporaceae bacterium]|nr:outer membrane protein assembly factor BamB [Micromonosporaceae bacterium]